MIARTVHHVEGVLHAARGMVFGSVERLEVVVVGLNLGTASHRVAHAEEDVRDFVDDAANQMTCAHLLHTARKRDIHRFGVHLRHKLGRCKLCLARLKRRLHSVTHFVGGFAHRGAVFGRKLAHAAQICGQRAFLAQHAHAHSLELRRVGSLRDAVQRGGFQIGKLVDYRHVSFAFPSCGHLTPAPNKKEPSFIPAEPRGSTSKDERRLSRYHLG